MRPRARALRSRFVVVAVAFAAAAALMACSTIWGFDELTGPGVTGDGGPSTTDGEGVAPEASIDPSITLTLMSSLDPAPLGTPITFTASIVGIRGTPTGSITFTDGATVLGASPISVGAASGAASLTTSSLALGVHTIAAAYGGDATYSAGATTLMTQTVNTTTTTTLASSSNPSSLGDSVTLTANVNAPVGGEVTGTVTFKDGTTVLSTEPLAAGTATLTTEALTPGTHTLTASYDGVPAFAPSISPDVTQIVVAPRCQGLPATCAGTNDCCATASIPGGTFSRSYDAVAHTDATYTATLSAFRLDLYEVTVGRFRTFVESRKGTQASPPAVGAGAIAGVTNSGWLAPYNTTLAPDRAALTTALTSCTFPAAVPMWTNTPGGNETKPMNCVTWHEAYAFCIWDGGRLPTEAEWNFVAAGGEEQRVYPWSDPPTSGTIDDSHAVYGAAVPAAVGSKPAGTGRWGHADLAGNVWEWTLDTFANPYPINPCNDCAHMTGGGNRAFRGGGYHYGAADTPVSLRRSAPASYRGADLGFRCARSP